MAPDPGDPRSPEEPVLIIWPTVAIEGAMADRDRLFDIIDRAAERMEAIDQADLQWLADQFWHDSRAKRIAGAILDVRKILAEAEPEDLEGGG